MKGKIDNVSNGGLNSGEPSQTSLSIPAAAESPQHQKQNAKLLVEGQKQQKGLKQWLTKPNFDYRETENSILNELDIRNPSSICLFEQHYNLSVQSKPSSKNYLKLRANQNLEWALNTVSEGIALAHEKEFEAAIVKYNSALEISHDCVDAFVARGAAHVKMQKLDQSIDDFEKALEIDSKHKNAKKYLKGVRLMIENAEREKKEILSGEFLLPNERIQEEKRNLDDYLQLSTHRNERDSLLFFEKPSESVPYRNEKKKRKQRH